MSARPRHISRPNVTSTARAPYLPMATRASVRSFLAHKYLIPHPPSPSPSPSVPLPRWDPNAQPLDYLSRPAGEETRVTQAAWDAALSELPLPSASPPAAIIYLNIGPWPPWVHFLTRSAAANSLVFFYFVGRQLNLRGCRQCFWLPMDAAELTQRLRTRLHLSARPAQVDLHHYRKLCDLKPLWPVLLPELSARHTWIGYADTDVLFGNLSDEVLHLQQDDELLVPTEFFPHPLANGNFLLMRANTKMMFAFNRSHAWRAMLASNSYQLFDEWNNMDAPGTMMAIYQDMFLAGQLLVRPTRRFIIQDVVMMRGRTYPSISAWGAKVNFSWRGGALFAERHGICVCPNDVIAHSIALTVCPQCLMLPGQALQGIVTHRYLEALGVHFQDWKKAWAKSERNLLMLHQGVRPPFAPNPVPDCAQTCTDFDLRPEGFICDKLQ